MALELDGLAGFFVAGRGGRRRFGGAWGPHGVPKLGGDFFEGGFTMQRKMHAVHSQCEGVRSAAPPTTC